MKKVVKFGGSSLASAEQFEKVGKIIRADESRRYVVPSAPGKRFSEDTKVTDLLYACYEAADDEGKFQKILEEIKARYQQIIDGLQISLSLEKEFEEVKENFKNQIGKEYAASRGEYLNGKIMAAYLGYEFVDPAEIIRFDGNGQFDTGITELLVAKKLNNIERAVVPGFYGAKENGEIKTFSRGYVIFLCDFDPFEKGKYRYTFWTACEETEKASLKDGRCIMFLNTRGENAEEVPKELVSFLKFVHADLKESQKDFQDDYVRQVQKSVTHIRESREMEERFMLLELLLKDERREGREEGRKTGQLEEAQGMLQMALNRFGELPENLLKTLHQQQDIEVIRNWMQIALKSQSLDDFISKM